MGAGKSILLVFLSILLTISVIFLGIFWGMHTFLYPQVYENALNNSGVYDSINLSEIQGGGSFIKLGPDGEKGLVNTLLENTLSYIRGDSKDLDLTVEVDTQKLRDFFLKNVDEIGACGPGESSFQGNQPVCRPADMNSSAYLDEVLEKRNFTIQEGEKVDLAEIFGINKTGTTQMRSYVMNYNEIYYGSLLLAIVLIVVVFFVSDSRTRWSGIDLIQGGIGVFVLGSVSSTLIASAIPPGVSFLQSISTDLANAFAGRLQTYSFVVTGIGIIGFVLSFFISKKKKEVEDNESPNENSL